MRLYLYIVVSPHVLHVFTCCSHGKELKVGMKRTILILIAALLVLLVYPSTHPIAKSLDPVDNGPIVITPYPGQQPIALTDSDDEDSDDGDADGLTGNRDRGTVPGGSDVATNGMSRLSMVFKMWWKYVIWVR